MTSPVRRALRTVLLVGGATAALLASTGVASAEPPPLPGPTPNHDVCVVWRSIQPAGVQADVAGSYCVEYWSPV